MNEPILPDTGAAPAATPSPGSEAPKGDATPSSENPPAFAVPDAYKDKPYVSKIKTQDDLWKQLDNTQALIGKKTVIPDFDKGDPKEIEDYVAQLRPKDKAAYKLDETIPEEDRTVITDIIHEAGVPAVMANKMMGGIMKHITGATEKMYGEDGLKGELKKSFGDDYEPIAKDTAKIISGLLNDGDKKLLEQVNNEHLGLIYRLAAGMKKQYGATEKGAGGDDPPGNIPATDKEALRKELRAEAAALSKRSHTEDERIAINNKIADTYK